MTNCLIKWSKKYQEELGEEDENGFFDHAYRYFIYCFYLPNKARITARRYTDTIDECAFYFYGANGQWERQASGELLQYLPHIVNFMAATQAVKQFRYFNGNYELLKLAIKNRRLAGVDFLEVPSE